MSTFTNIDKALGKGIASAASSMDAKFVVAITAAAKQAPAKCAAKGVLTDVGTQYVTDYVGAVFGKESKARAAWMRAELAGNTFRSYKARSKPALAALLALGDEVEGVKSLAKLSKAGTDAELVKAHSNGNGKGKGKAPANTLDGDTIKHAQSLLSRMPKKLRAKAYGSELATFLRTLPGVSK